MGEVWKDVRGFEGMYMVSDCGRVKGLDRTIVTCNGNTKRIRGRMLRPAYTRGDYLFVCLHKDGGTYEYRINRLVALNFIPNPNGYDQVGHDDDNRENNHVSNLYWTDAKENSTHNGRHLLVGQKLRKPIIGTRGNETVRFTSSLDARRGGFNASAIRNCLTGRSATHQGYRWAYAAR